MRWPAALASPTHTVSYPRGERLDTGPLAGHRPLRADLGDWYEPLVDLGLTPPAMSFTPRRCYGPSALWESRITRAGLDPRSATPLPAAQMHAVAWAMASPSGCLGGPRYWRVVRVGSAIGC
jgi:hypothetical protein